MKSISQSINPSSTRRHGAVFGPRGSTMPHVVVLSALTGEELLSANYEHLDGPGDMDQGCLNPTHLIQVKDL